MEDNYLNIKNEIFKPVELSCEYAYNPLGIDTTRPRLSWRVDFSGWGRDQKAYRIIVANSKRDLEDGFANMWDSGRVESNQSINIVYSGMPLTSGMRCYWKVCIWDNEDNESLFSEMAMFDMGLLSENDWKGGWMGFPAGKNGGSLYFRKDFDVRTDVVRATVYICGLGYYELSINGRKVGDYVLDPGFTEYEKRVLYTTYDSTSYLKMTSNTLGVVLGNGWYGAPKFILQMNIEYMDGTSTSIVSDPNTGWNVSGGPIVQNSIFDGEVYDARLEKLGWDTPEYVSNLGSKNMDGWIRAMTVEAPSGRMISQQMEPIKIVEEIKPLSVTNPLKGIYVFDMGQNMVGWSQIKVQGSRGTEVKLRFAEILYKDGTVNQENLRTALCRDIYILKGDGLETYEPKFTYHGFRYVQIEGYPGTPSVDDVIGCVVRSAVKQIGKYSCSNELINQINKNVLWTEAGNLHSIPTDCPQRDERMGWLNDAAVRAEEAMFNFNMSRFYSKWLNDIDDAQDAETGAITDTAPFRWGMKPADPVCGCNIILSWLLYIHYGDIRILEQHYSGMKNWMKCLANKSEGYIINYSYYGDWASPVKFSILNSACSAITPGALMSTGYYYYYASIITKVAKILNQKEDEAYFRILAQNIKKAFNKSFYNPATFQYAGGSQASNTLPLFLGITPEIDRQNVIRNIVKDIEAKEYHLTTGNLCTKYIMEVLSEEGYVDIAYRIATQTSYPSWGYMVKNGATTMWERWENSKGNGMNSHNHPMYATIGSWFYKYLCGINADEDMPGFKRIIIKPYTPERLKFVDASLNTIRGLISSSWRRENGSFLLKVFIPFNCTARIFLPKAELKTGFAIFANNYPSPIWKNGGYINTVECIVSGEETKDYFVFDVGSGEYCFSIMPEYLVNSEKL